MTRRRKDKRIWYLVLAVFVAVFLFTFLVESEDKPEVDAASLNNFNAGYIISDYQMSNYQSMTESEVQAFLKKKNACSNTNKGLYDSLTARYKNIHWHFKNGHFVCLSEELFGDGVAYGEDLAKGKGETAAHIIWQAAQDYKINPQVLIVLLEKEQSLITDTYPNSGQYRSATGYGCPDTAPCAEKYYGFKNQVRKAAELFRTVLNGGWTNYPLGNNYIQYNPSASCGGSVVNVKNLATSALYRYTPYQPNAATLAAGYGTAECGAYGNRNFYLYFQDWFGGITNEAEYIGLETPRYMVTKSDIKAINTDNGSSDGQETIKSGTVLKFTTKIWYGQEWCLRTESNTKSKMKVCIPFSKLKELSLKYEDVPANEQYKIIKSGARKIKINTGSNGSEVFKNSLARVFIKKTSLNGKIYYLTEYDWNNNRMVGIESDLLTNEGSYEKVNYTFNVKKGAKKINFVDNKNLLTMAATESRNFKAKITVGDKVFYQTEYDYNNGNYESVFSVDDVDFIAFEKPRNMKVANNTTKVNLDGKKIGDELSAGKIIHFSSKCVIGGEWYYRTTYDTKNNLPYIIPAKALREV